MPTNLRELPRPARLLHHHRERVHVHSRGNADPEVEFLG